MGRLVEPTRIVRTAKQPDGRAEGVDAGPLAAEPADAGQTVEKQGDAYLERIAKYIPAEVIAFFIFANSILKQSKTDHQTLMAGFTVEAIGMTIFVLAWICVPVYLWRLAEPGAARGVNAAMATLLFPVWCYAVEGVGVTHVVPFDGHLASIVLGAASLLSGLVAPTAKHVA